MYSNNSSYRKRSFSKSPSRERRGIKRNKNYEDEGNSPDCDKNDDMTAISMNMLMNQQGFASGNMGGMYTNMVIPSNMLNTNMMSPNMMASNMMTTNVMAPNMMTMDMMSNQANAMTCQPIVAQDMMGNIMDATSMMAMCPSVDTEMVGSEEKCTIVLKSCVLTPPSNNAEPQVKRPRPPGCRTIFVGGLPDKNTETIVRDIFEMYGHILSLRLSHKKFCHIRYENENSVSAAIALSGYKLKILGDMEDEEDYRALCGFIHVDYAMSRDDQNEYKRKQRQALRMQRGDDVYQDLMPKGSGMQMSTYSLERRSVSPISVHTFSTMAIVQIAERIKSEEHFASTLPTLIAWLEKGECSKKNSNQFYSMIQTTNSHIRRLYGEKVQCDEDLLTYKERIKKRLEKVISELDQVAKVFNAAMHQRVWDHFTKPQRKNITTWQKMAQELSNFKEEFYEKFEYEDMEFDPNNRSRTDSVNSNDFNALKKENERLKFQLEAYKNEIDIVKQESVKEMEKFKAQFIARQALQSAMEKKVIPTPTPRSNTYAESEECYIVSDEPKTTEVFTGDARLIGVISAFLQVHPQGASLDYVVSYVRALYSSVTHADVHRILQKYVDVFERKTMGIGANIEHRWLFCAYKDIN